MRYLKKYNDMIKESDNANEDIADDIISKLEKIRGERGRFTIEDYESYMTERGSDDVTMDSVMHYLVDKGFNFDSKDEEEADVDNLENIKLIEK